MTRKINFSDAETIRIFYLRDVEKLKWHQIARKFPGRGKTSCYDRYWYVNLDMTAAARFDLLSGEAPRKRAPAPPRDLPAPSARARSTSTMVDDAELRRRISILGPTGGLLGDPLPGRSALDELRALAISNREIEVTS